MWSINYEGLGIHHIAMITREVAEANYEYEIFQLYCDEVKIWHMVIINISYQHLIE